MRSEARSALVALALLAGCGTSDHVFDNVVDPALLAGVTRFRSCCGHSFAVGESNRTMKHYLIPQPAFVGTDHALPVHAPCDGELVSISPEENTLPCQGGATRGFQLRFVCRARPDVSLRVFHVNPARGPGSVDAGELVGYADLRSCGGYADFDVAVEKLGSLHSYIQWLKDGPFDAWEARGLPSREAAVIGAGDRDARPCNYGDMAMCQADTIVFP